MTKDERRVGGVSVCNRAGIYADVGCRAARGRPRRYIAAVVKRKPDDLYDEPLKVQVFRGAVVLLGPGMVAIAMTIEAAEPTLTPGPQRPAKRQSVKMACRPRAPPSVSWF